MPDVDMARLAALMEGLDHLSAQLNKVSTSLRMIASQRTSTVLPTHMPGREGFRRSGDDSS